MIYIMSHWFLIKSYLIDTWQFLWKTKPINLLRLGILIRFILMIKTYAMKWTFYWNIVPFWSNSFNVEAKAQTDVQVKFKLAYTFRDMVSTEKRCSFKTHLEVSDNSANIYLCRVNNRRCEICSKLTIKISERD